MASSKAPKDPINRGDKRTNQLGIATFVGLRLIDPFLQYSILAQNYGSSIITRLGGTVLAPGPPLATNTAIDVGLSPYRSILLGFSAVAMLKQNLHVLFIMQEKIDPGFAAQVGAFNATFDTLNSLFFICAQTSASVNGQTFPQTPLLIGSTLFAVGLGIEFGSEIQRHLWKRDAANKGQVYTGGLFGLSRHINYFGYTMWRTGYALAAGGWIWAGVAAAMLSYTFVSSSIPSLQHYLEHKYGAKYESYKAAVPYKFIPYVY